MPNPAREPTFLPLTVSAAVAAASGSPDPALRAAASLVWRRAEAANTTAADCWAALLAGCAYSSVLRALPVRLGELTGAVADYAGYASGGDWWRHDGSVHRRRVARAEQRVAEAVRDSDGAEFAEAFVGYDHAVATAVVSVQSRTGSPTT